MSTLAAVGMFLMVWLAMIVTCGGLMFFAEWLFDVKEAKAQEAMSFQAVIMSVILTVMVFLAGWI